MFSTTTPTIVNKSLFLFLLIQERNVSETYRHKYPL